MKLIPFLATIFSTTNTESNSMKPFETLKYLEDCYEAIQPAVEKTEQAFAWFSDIPHPLFNAVMHISSDDVASKIEDLLQKAPLGHSISFWVHPENRADGLVELLKERGFAHVITCPLMVWRAKPMIVSAHDIRLAKEDMITFNEITSIVSHFDEATKQKYSDILKTFDSENYLIFSENEPIGAGILFSKGKKGGIFNVSVLPEHQKKGHGRAMMEFLMNRANELQLKELILLSSPAAEKLYLDLGFKKVFDIDIYAQ